MVYSKILIIAGFVVGGIGALIAAVLGHRVPGGIVFAVGFYLVVAGIVGGLFSEQYQERVEEYGVGIKIGAVGFVIASLSFLAALLKAKEAVVNTLFYSGLIAVTLGIFLIFFRIIK